MSDGERQPEPNSAAAARTTSLTVIVPVYNEQYLIASSLERLKILAESPLLRRVQVIVVDDCSRDATPSILSEFQRRVESSRGKLTWEFIRHERNQGKGGAVRTGIERAECELTVAHDADLEYHPQDLLKMAPLFLEEGADAVYGSRFLGRHRVFLFTHYLGNRIVTLATNLLYNTMLTDMETCYKEIGRASCRERV